MFRKSYPQWGFYSFFGLSFLLFGITLNQGVNYVSLLGNFLHFLFGGVRDVQDGSKEGLLSIVLNSSALMLVTLVITIVLSIVTSKILGLPRSYSDATMDLILDKGPRPLFKIIIIEEVIARIIPLGLYLLIFKNPVMFYILLLAGNAFWAYLHLSNFENTAEQHVLRVLPQFVAGLFLGYLFIRYGFLVALMAHYLYDVLLLSTRKETRPQVTSWFTIAYFAIVGGISLLILHSHGVGPSVISPWFSTDSTITRISTISFWDYVFIAVLISAISDIIAEVFVLDKIQLTEGSLDLKILGVATLLDVAVILFLNWAFAFVISNAVTRAVLITILLTLLRPTTSGSALARVFLTDLPARFVIIVALTVLGFWSGTWLLLLLVVVGFIPMLLHAVEEDL